MISDELKAWIGRTETYVAPEEVGAAAIRYFALALGDANPLYHDAAYTGASRYGEIIAPPTMVCETSQFIRRLPDQTGYLGHQWSLPIKSTRFIRGGNDYEFHQPVTARDRITTIWTILEIFDRITKAYGAAIFVVSEARYKNEREELLAINRETIVYIS